MVEMICIGVACVSAGVAIASQISLYKQKRWMNDVVADIEHFLLYPEDMKEEILEEGYQHNLMNEIIKLESQVVYDKKLYDEKGVYVDSFIENMAHQMKTSITAIQLRLDFALAQCKDSKEEGLLLKIQDSLARLTSEVERLLTASQLAAGKVLMVYEQMNIYQILKKCVERFKELAEKRKVKFVLTGAQDLVYYGDEFWLAQALENVIKNAMEHTDEGSKVFIRVEEKGRFISILIEDEGEGIPAEEMDLLFKRFCRGNSRKKGYGIGLSMAKDIIQTHHGKIRAENREEKGARFEILLPILSGADAYKNESSI